MRILIVYLVLFLLAGITVLATSYGSSKKADAKPADVRVGGVGDEDGLPLANEGSEPGPDEGSCLACQPDCEVFGEGLDAEELPELPTMVASRAQVRR